MALATRVVLFLSIVLTAKAGGSELSLQATPAFLIIAKNNGLIMRCIYERTQECEVVLKTRSGLLSTLVHGDHFYVTSGKVIHRCSWYKNNPCTFFYEADAIITSLVAGKGYLFAGLFNGTLLRCEFNLAHTCSTVHEFQLPISGLHVNDRFIYVALKHSYIDYCSLEVTFTCIRVSTNSDLSLAVKSRYSIVTAGTRIFNRFLSYYSLTSNGYITSIKNVTLPGALLDLSYFKRRIYVIVSNPELFSYDTMRSEENNETIFNEFVRYYGEYSISFAYGVHHMNELVHSNSRLCSRQPRPSAVFNYREEHRRVVEATVVDGELRDSRGAAVDTRNADVGYSGRVAVFAMGPDGQLLLSTSHRSGLIHITSFFAGSPVSGAGEMIVEDGVVKKIIACSEYYLPDIKLNKQVVEALFAKGYTRADDIILEECAYTC